MALKALLDSLDGIDASLKSHYTEVKDGPHRGKFVLGVEGVGGFALEDVAGVKGALQKERALREERDALLKAFEGLDPAAARDALTQLEKLKDAVPKDQLAGLVDRAVKDLKAKLEGDLKATGERATKAEQRARDLAVNQRAIDAFGKHKAKGGRTEALLALLRDKLDVKFEDGKLEPVIRIKGPDGIPVPSRKAGSDAAMDVDEFVGVMREEMYPEFFEGSGHSGTGANGGSIGGGGGANGKFTIPESVARTDHSKYREVRDAAEKVGQSVQVVPG